MESSTPRYLSRCATCGKPATVFLGSTSYCQECYNHLTDYLAGVQSPTNDNYQVLALDARGRTVEFAVERYSFGTSSVWTAVEQVAPDDPRKEQGYVGRSVSIAVDARRQSQDQALDALMVKVQHLVDHASIRPVPRMLGRGQDTPELGVRLSPDATRMLCANKTGVARIEVDEQGNKSVVVDGQRLTPQQFVDLFARFEGFDLFWQVQGVVVDPPEWL